MKRHIKYFAAIAVIISAVHFIVLMVLASMQASAFASILDRTYDGTMQQVQHLDSIFQTLTFPVMQTVGRARPVGTTPDYVAPLTTALLPLTSLLWGTAIAFALTAFHRMIRKETQNVEHIGAP